MKKLIHKYDFNPAEQTLTLHGIYAQKRVLIVTNVTRGESIYVFNSQTLGADSVNIDFENGLTIMSLKFDTSAMSADDELQIFLEEDHAEIEPSEALLDPVSKFRVSNPENLIDTDFEYGLQSTKWETLQTVNNIPTIYSSNGDTPIDGLVSVEAINGSKNILVTTNIPHGLAIGDPISVQGLSQYQAEGFFIVTSVADDLNFFFELDVPATFSGDISGSYTTIVPSKFFEGSTLPVSTADGANTDAQSPSTISVQTQETHGFSTGTKVYLRNTVGPRALRIEDSTLTAPDGRPFVDTVSSFNDVVNVDNTTSTGRGSFNDRNTVTYDWESTYTFYLDPSAVDPATDEITWGTHNLRDGYTLLFNTAYHGLTDGGLTDGTVYYVEVIDADTIRLHNSSNLTSLVSLSNLTNTFGKARLGLVYKVEQADGTKRFTEANLANRVSLTGFTRTDGGQNIQNPDGANTRTTNVDVTATLGGNPTSVRIRQFLVAGDHNSSSETITVTIGNTTITSRTGRQDNFPFYRLQNDTFSGFDVTPFLFTSGGRTFFTVTHSIPSSVDDLGWGFASAIDMELENTSAAGGGNLTEDNKKFSGGDLYDAAFGLGGVQPTALVAFQGRTPTSSFSDSGDQFSFLANQREAGRYGTLSVKYNNVVTGTGSSGSLDASFDIDLVDNNDTYGSSAEIYYIFARPVSADRNTILIPNHGISDEGTQTITIDVDATQYGNGERFSFGSSNGSVTDMPEQFQADVTVLNPDVIRITTTQSPNTNDIARIPQNFSITYTRENPNFNSIYISNHKVRADTEATYTNLTGDAIPPLTNGQVLELERVDDNRLKLKNSGPAQNAEVVSDIGAANSSNVTYFIPAETDLGFVPATTVINRLRFRGDFSASFEYVDIEFDDGDTYRIGQNDDIGDSSSYATSTTFSGKDVTSLLVDNGGVLGFNVRVDPTSSVNFSPGLPNNWWWQLEFRYVGDSGNLVFEGPGSGSHEFLVSNLVGAYDGVFEMTNVPTSKSFEMASDFRIPSRLYEFTSSDINTGVGTITFAEPHNLITGEQITYDNGGNTDMLNTAGSNDFFAIVINDTTIKVASSFQDALENTSLPITSQTGTHSFTSNNVIKNIKGQGTVTTVQGSKDIVGAGTNFLTSFKRFDKIYINNGTYVEEKTVDTITTSEKMTIFEEATSSVSGNEYYYATQLSLRPDGYSIHLPFDGGVDITAGTSPNSRIVRQTRKYFRYQSGKGIQNSFAINFNPPKLVRELIKSTGNTATILTQEQHNLKPGDGVRVTGATVSAGANPYNGTFIVDTTPDEFSFTYTMSETPLDVRAGGFPKFVRTGWTDSFVRAGMFDDQNGFFFEYDGQNLNAVRRSSTQQIAGSVNVNRGSQVIQGVGTSFTSQLQIGENVVIRGQSYKIVEVSSDQRIVVQPAYRGIEGRRVKITKTVDTKTPQALWNIDPADGTGKTGYKLDINKIQMAYIDYSWYGAGKIRYGFKDNNGHVKYFHEYKHNNILDESYFRSGNLPGRYEIENGSAATTAPTLFHFGTSIIMDGKFDDDKAYQFTGQSKPFAFTNGSSSNITSNGNSVFEQVTLEGRRVYVYSIPVDESTAQQAVEGLQIEVDGTNDLPNGTYVTQVRLAGANSRIFTSFPATSSDPTGGTVYSVIPTSSTLVLGETEAIDLTRPIPLISVRLAPSVDNSVTGSLGEREIINRMQLRLLQASVTSSTSIEVFLIQNTIPSTIDYEKAQRPSLSEVIRHSAGDTLLQGTTIYSTKSSAGSLSFSLEDLLEIGNSILGGDGIFPAGPDLLTLAVQPQNTSNITGTEPFFVTGKISWSESQA